MAQFLHIFDERNLSRIRKNGIKKSKWNAYRGVYVFARTENFEINHQWMRELRRHGGLNMLVARIRIPDNTMVKLGKFNEPHIDVEASEAIGITRDHRDPLGLEVVIPRSILPKEIESIYKLPKVTGWRYSPRAKRRRPCGCAYCQRGEPYSRKIRKAYENS